jgi:hypothetical protein
MKSLLFLIVLSVCAFSVNAQKGEGCDLLNPGDSVNYVQVWNWSIGELKEAAKQSYFNLCDVINDKTSPFDKEKLDKALDQYDYWRKVVGLKLSNKKDRDAFYGWIVAQARIAGKLTYKEDKKS